MMQTKLLQHGLNEKTISQIFKTVFFPAKYFVYKLYFNSITHLNGCQIQKNQEKPCKYIYITGNQAALELSHGTSERGNSCKCVCVCVCVCDIDCHQEGELLL